MKSPVHKSYLLQGFAGAVAVNLLLFCSLPGLIKFETGQTDLESLTPVYVARLKPEPPRPKPKEKPPEKKEPPKPRIQRVKQLKPHRPPPRNLALNMPEMDLDIDPRISGGIPVIAPPTPAGPQVQSGSLPDFNAIMDQSKVDVMPALTFRRNPRYPYRAKRMGIEGQVKIRFLVDKNGLVSRVEILSADPPDIFNNSVIEAVSNWKYSPGELLGRKVATLVTTSVIFKLEAD